MEEGPTRQRRNRAEQVATWLAGALLLFWLAVLVRAVIRDFWVILITFSQP